MSYQATSTQRLGVNLQHTVHEFTRLQQIFLTKKSAMSDNEFVVFHETSPNMTYTIMG